MKKLLRKMFGSGSDVPKGTLFDRVIARMFGGGRAPVADIPINRRTAMQFKPVWQGVNLLANDVGKLPLRVLQKQEDGGRLPYREHPAWRLLRRKPSPELTANQFIRTLTGHAVLLGNGYAYIARNGLHEPAEFWPLDPEATFPIRVDGQLWYIVNAGGEHRKVSPADILHIRGLGFDGLVGYSFIDFAAQSIGLGLAAEKHGARFFSHGGVAEGIIEVPGRISEDQEKMVRETYESLHTGLDAKHRIAVFHSGFKFHQLTIPNEQAQFLETREFSNKDIAGWLNLPPHKLGDNSQAARATLEAENQSYLDTSLEPWLTAWEAECWDKLLTEDEKESEEVYVEFHRQALLRLDARTRGAWYHRGLQDGWLNRDQICDMENLPRLPNGEGAKYFVPLNMALLGEDGTVEVIAGSSADALPANEPDNTLPDEQPAEPAALAIQSPSAGVVLAINRTCAAAAGRMIRWEVGALNKLAAKGGNLVGAGGSIEQFYEQHEPRMAQALVEPAKVLAALYGRHEMAAERIAQQAANKHVEQSRDALLRLAEQSTPEAFAGKLANLLAGWESRTDEVARGAILLNAEFWGRET